jgi:hypothetical protein
MKQAPRATVLHVYGVVGATSPAVPGVLGRRGAPVRRVRHGPVALLVSDLPSKSRLGRADLLDHAHVLEQVAERECVLPMRFGVQAENEEDLHAQVKDARTWASLLRRFAELIQLSVHATHRDDEALREVLRREPALLKRRKQLRNQDVWEEQANKIELGKQVAAALEILRQEDAVAVLDQLMPVAEEAAERTESGYVLRASFLVKRTRRKAFDRAVTKVQRELPRLDLLYLGPQPPWAFLDVEEASEPSWGS